MPTKKAKATSKKAKATPPNPSSPQLRPIRFTGALLMKTKASAVGPAGSGLAPLLQELGLRAAPLNSLWPASPMGVASATPATPGDLSLWQVVEPMTAGVVSEAQVLDTMWQLLRNGDNQIEFVEPEFEYSLDEIPPSPSPSGHAIAPAGGGPNLWHLDVIKAQGAWNVVGGREKAGEGITVAHLDTGYTDHDVIVAMKAQDRLDTKRAYDFVDRKTDAQDPKPDALWRMPGHGTGTLGILAGNDAANNYFGVAPGVNVLPVRIGRSVIHIRTRELGMGIYYAAHQGAQVISLSMGGLPSQYWADAVNFAYENGTLLVAAAGNHFPLLWGKVRTPDVVIYPARFERAVAVSGIMAGDLRYRFDDGVLAGTMCGNDGPEVGVCAPTPNICWADGKKLPNGFVADGAGTSSATPQVAATAAMWLALNKNELAGMQPWERVECCRAALLLGARKVSTPGTPQFTNVPNDPLGRTRNDWFGDGCLDCEKTLQVTVAQVRSSIVRRQPADARGAVMHLLGFEAAWSAARAAFGY